jgi:uncharacterized protein YaaR (DUF327 family)
MPIGAFSSDNKSSGIGILSQTTKTLTDFQMQILQLGHALTQKNDVENVLKYLYIIRDNYLQNIENIQYLNEYPTPPYIIWNNPV